MKPAKACKFVEQILSGSLNNLLILSGFKKVYQNRTIYKWLWVYFLLPFLQEDSLNELAEKHHKPLLKLYRILATHPQCFAKLFRLISEKKFFDLLKKFQAMPDYERSRQPLFLIADDTQAEKFGKQMEFIAKLFDHAKKKYIQGYNYFFVIAVQGNLVLPLYVQLWLPKKSEDHESKNDMLASFCIDLQVKSQDQQVSLKGIELLCDSAYLVGKVVDTLVDSPITIISKASDRQKFEFEGEQLTPSQIIEKVKDRKFDLFDASNNEEYQHIKSKHHRYGYCILTVRKRKLKNGTIVYDVHRLI